MQFSSLHRYEIKWNSTAVEFWYDYQFDNVNLSNVPITSLPVGLRVSSENGDGWTPNAPFKPILSLIIQSPPNSKDGP